MPSPPKSAKGRRSVTHVLADGSVKVYSYDKYARQPLNDSDTLRALIRDYQQSPEWRALSPKTQKLRVMYLRPLQSLAAQPYAEIVRRDVMTMRDAMAHRGAGAANQFLKSTRVLFSWAIQHDRIAFNPADRIPSLAGGSFKAWTGEQADLAMARLPERLARVVLLARYTGQRRGDLCKMRWSDYDGTTIAVVQEKTGAELVIPVIEELRASLDSWARPADTILTNNLLRPWDPDSLTVSFSRQLEKLGMPGELSLHGLRKLAAAELANAGCTAHMIQSITGHQTLKEVERYTRSADQRRLAFEAIERLSNHARKAPPRALGAGRLRLTFDDSSEA
jgi:integrase